MIRGKLCTLVLVGIVLTSLTCSRADKLAGENAACVGALLIGLLLLLILAASAPDIWKWWE